MQIYRIDFFIPDNLRYVPSVYDCKIFNSIHGNTWRVSIKLNFSRLYHQSLKKNLSGNWHGNNQNLMDRCYWLTSTLTFYYGFMPRCFYEKWNQPLVHIRYKSLKFGLLVSFPLTTILFSLMELEEKLLRENNWWDIVRRLNAFICQKIYKLWNSAHRSKFHDHSTQWSVTQQIN